MSLVPYPKEYESSIRFRNVFISSVQCSRQIKIHNIYACVIIVVQISFDQIKSACGWKILFLSFSNSLICFPILMLLFDTEIEEIHHSKTAINQTDPNWSMMCDIILLAIHSVVFGANVYRRRVFIENDGRSIIFRFRWRH